MVSCDYSPQVRFCRLGTYLSGLHSLSPCAALRRPLIWLGYPFLTEDSGLAGGPRDNPAAYLRCPGRFSVLSDAPLPWHLVLTSTPRCSLKQPELVPRPLNTAIYIVLWGFWHRIRYYWTDYAWKSPCGNGDWKWGKCHPQGVQVQTVPADSLVLIFERNHR